MARDGVFFKAVGRLDPRTRVPVVAIVLQGVWAAVIALTGKYDQILNYVESIDVLFFGLTGASLLIFRARESRAKAAAPAPGRRARSRPSGDDDALRARVLGGLGVDDRAVPESAGIGVVILLVGVVVFWLWVRASWSAQRSLSENVLRGGRVFASIGRCETDHTRSFALSRSSSNELV